MQFELVSIIIPAYNERESLGELYDRITATLSAIEQPFEFIVIDDGSTDGSFEMLREMRETHSNIIAIRHFRNHGKSLALTQGFDIARGEVAVMMDADLQDQPEMIPAFLDKIAEGYDLVNGWRNRRKDTAGKRFVSRVFNRLTAKAFNCHVHDINCGFKAFRRHVYKDLELYGDMHRLIPAWVATKGHRVTEIPVPHEDRKYGTSKFKLLRHRGLLDIIALMASNTTQLRPFHVFCEVAFFFWLLAGLCLAGWLTATSLMPADILSTKWVTSLVALTGLWSLSVGTLLPVMGFYMEVESKRFQGSAWRANLIRDRLGAAHGPDRHMMQIVHDLWQASGVANQAAKQSAPVLEAS